MIRTTCATALLMLACINTGHATEAEDELAACRAIEADAERVACYDAIAHGQVDEEEEVEEAEEDVLAVVPAAVAVEVATSPAATPSSDEDFGKSTTDDDLTRDAEKPDSDDDELTATVTSVRLYKRDRVVFTLDNGQEWRQSSASTLRLDVGDKIVIRKATFGSFKMAKVGSSRSMRVRRND